MNRVLLFVLLLVVGKGALSQERIDTLYYSRSGMTVRNPVFADYYRLALYPADAAGLKMFKDFYISGELRREGRFQTIDTLDDRRTVFDGDVVSYFKNGRMSEKSYYSEGLLEGEYRQYDENGTLKTRASYAGGELSGMYEAYNGDGSCRMVEYRAGLPVHDYYLLADGSGNTLKFRIADDMPVWESPVITERSVDLIISNNSLTPVEFNPETDMTAYSVDEHDVATDLQVWSCDSYLKKVNRSQTWAAVLMGVSEGMASAGAGYSTSTTTGYSSYGGYSSYTTTTYNPSAAYQANMASQQRIADFGQALQDEQQVKKLGYLKKNTIYPGESVSGFVHVAWIKGERAVFIIRIEGAEYIYEWGFDKKNAFLLNKNN